MLSDHSDSKNSHLTNKCIYLAIWFVAVQHSHRSKTGRPLAPHHDNVYHVSLQQLTGVCPTFKCMSNSFQVYVAIPPVFRTNSLLLRSDFALPSAFLEFGRLAERRLALAGGVMSITMKSCDATAGHQMKVVA